MICYVIKDLLPNYLDGLNSDETNAIIEEHLKTCNVCRNFYQKMSDTDTCEVTEQENGIDFLRKLRKKMQHRSLGVAVSTCIVLIFFLVLLKNWQVTLPFDPEHMGVKIFQVVPMTDRDGNISWEDVDSLDFFTSQAVMEGDYEVMDLIQIYYQQIFCASQRTCARTINRDGETVRIIYYCYTESLWDHLFFKPGSKDWIYGRTYDSSLYGSQYQSPDYQPQMREIYYLQVKNIEGLEKLSDEEFDEQKEHAILVWKGMI